MSAGSPVRRLLPDDAPALASLRRQALDGDPLAFGASVEDDRLLSVDFSRAMLGDPREHAIFGLFLGSDLAGMVGVMRDPKRKRRHAATIWGMYVAPEARGKARGRALLDAAIQQARELVRRRAGAPGRDRRRRRRPPALRGRGLPGVGPRAPRPALAGAIRGRPPPGSRPRSPPEKETDDRHRDVPRGLAAAARPVRRRARSPTGWSRCIAHDGVHGRRPRLHREPADVLPGHRRRRRPARLLLQGRAARASCGWSTRTRWRSRATTATACSRAWATSSSTRRSACCSSTSRARSACASMGGPPWTRTTRCCAELTGAQLVVRVRAEAIFPNCPRYIHRMQLVETLAVRAVRGARAAHSRVEAAPGVPGGAPAGRPRPLGHVARDALARRSPGVLRSFATAGHAGRRPPHALSDFGPTSDNHTGRKPWLSAARSPPT